MDNTTTSNKIQSEIDDLEQEVTKLLVERKDLIDHNMGYSIDIPVITHRIHEYRRMIHSCKEKQRDTLNQALTTEDQKSALRLLSILEDEFKEYNKQFWIFVKGTPEHIIVVPFVKTVNQVILRRMMSPCFP